MASSSRGIGTSTFCWAANGRQVVMGRRSPSRLKIHVTLGSMRFERARQGLPGAARHFTVTLPGAAALPADHEQLSVVASEPPRRLHEMAKESGADGSRASRGLAGVAQYFR
eukprot:CAMPEP_0204115832 /NCGR_PEP_ID=MMETSP0361-20130328/5052_1 /ASSEMBLY_ACC=CAM_ASM_000343 /TAXON_ID=268821 /ORGANISM="Scrippsiella Hangoei, Strain SHTV-5" /LENGTH=111 /DNA_ID=CAMNT_0051066535 /DNA_START=96 /DNA_END=429 /DNA_ORIENTATION=+